MTLNPEVFREAAVLVDKPGYKYCCHVIQDCDDSSHLHLDFFIELFKPPDAEEHEAWFTDDEPETAADQPLGKNRRVIALLLAAEVLESGGI